MLDVRDEFACFLLKDYFLCLLRKRIFVSSKKSAYAGTRSYEVKNSFESSDMHSSDSGG